MPERHWFVYLNEDATARQRVRFRTERGEVERFAVQLEALRDGLWQPVIRYDGVHGFAHCDRLRRDGEQRKEDLGLNFADALTYAESDIQANWRRYLERFDEGDWP